MGPDAVIRPAIDQDVPAIREIIARIYADYGDVLDIEREDPHLRDPLTYFRAGGGELWVAECDGVVAGSTGVKLDPPWAEIKTVYVAHEFRRRGLARRLTGTAIAHARERGCPRLALWSDTRYVEAHRLYESLGFVRVGRRDVSIVNTFSEFRYELR
jgi:putative acetyltransferase